MSLTNVVPWWVWEAHYEEHLAKMLCCFDSEWNAGISKVLPKSMQKMIHDNMNSEEETA